MSYSAADEAHMRTALSVARQGLYSTDPNPRVGCVLAKNGVVIATGAHMQAGGPHAEVHALRAAGEAARGATCYVTLEPCNHHGRTPPCRQALIDAGVSRVVVAMTDGHEKASGGLERLREAGIEVASGLLAAESRELNIGFHQRCDTGRPWLRLKLAASMDGRTAAADGSSQWITGAEARADVQRWRARSSLLVTGAGTVRDDDPHLNVRLPGVDRQPGRVVISRTFDVPASAHIFHSPGQSIIYGVAEGPGLRRLRDAGINTRRLEPAKNSADAAAGDHIDLIALTKAWAGDEVNEVFVECGPNLAGAWLNSGQVDELVLYLAPKLLGDGGRPLAHLPRIQSLSDALSLKMISTKVIGGDIRIVLRRGEAACSVV